MAAIEKKEPQKQEAEARPKPAGISGKISFLSGKAFGIIKFLLGVFLLPFVFSSSLSFLWQFWTIEKYLQNSFWWGIVSFLLIYLFVWEPAGVYNKGHRLLEIIFSFFKPLVKIAPYLLPIYTVVLFVVYAALSAVIKEAWLIKYCLFFAGLTVTLHLVFSAKTIRGKKGDFLKGNYIFGFSFIYILNIALLAFFLNLIFKEFSFVNFINASYINPKDIFYALFKQLFLK